MKVTIQPSQLKGNIQAPASKSSMQRACAAALLAKGTTVIHKPGHSNDDLAAIGIIEGLGALVEGEGSPLVKVKKDQLYIKSEGVCPITRDINCGESGLSIRMFTPIVALSETQITIKGEGSLKGRPMDFFDEILPQLGVKIKTNNGKVPMIIQGPLQPKNIEVDGSLSSQFLTGLLLAFATSSSNSFSKGEGGSGSSVSIKVNNLKSKPYIDLTLDVMKKFGMNLPENKNYEEFIFYRNSTHDSRASLRAEQINTTHDYTVESDWSGGAFLLVAGAIAGDILVSGLDPGSSQADNAVLDALMAANAGFAFEAKGIRMNPAPMIAFEFDATDCPDLFPPLVALAVYCKGETKIKGVSRLTHKESNRAMTLQEEFGKMGVKIELNDDIMIIHGGKGVKGAVVHSRHDHRIAMALAVAALKAEGETVIEEAQAVKKSYPDFYSDLRSLHASLSLPFQLIGE